MRAYRSIPILAATNFPTISPGSGVLPRAASLLSEVKASAMKLSHNGNSIDPTLRDLIATISDVAFEYAADRKEAYDIARIVLVEILKGPSRTKKVVNRRSTKYLH